jgi:hypothetical protein
MTSTRQRFNQHKASAIQRGIAFLLTFEQWAKIWKASGKLENRGCRKGQYVMARFNDKGSYSIKNVQIIPQEQNHKEARPNQRYTPAGKLTLSSRTKGEKNGNAKLRQIDVERIRTEYELQNGRRGVATNLAKKYRVTSGAIYAIVHRKTWKFATANQLLRTIR